MCGIAGWAGHGDPDHLQKMIHSLKHRGPDETGLWADQSAALGIARLSIIDVADGHQPVFSLDEQVVAVLNGEIYNFQELAKEIIGQGGQLNSGSDAEVIPHLYERHGPDFVNHLRGMFAIALWDKKRHRLLLARDRVGKKPLVFRRHNGTLLFASEARALLAADWKPDADLNALNHVLAFGQLPRETGAFQGLDAVPPGHIAIWESGELAMHQYWSWEPQAQLDASEVRPALEDVLENAVRVRMVSERPIGAFLSGGVDSSIVTALMVRNHSNKIKTFSIGFEDKHFDEAPYATEVAGYLGTDHTTLHVNPNPDSLLSRLVDTYDQPLADSSALPTMLLSELARNHVVVALSGDGGDEAFGGYERYLAAPTLQRLNSLLAALRPVTRMAAKFAATGNQQKFSRLLGEMQSRHSLLDRYRALMTLMPLERRSRLWTREARQQFKLSAPETEFDLLWNQLGSGSDLWKMRSHDLNSYLPGDLLTKVDIASMSTSLEVRSPFLDHEVLQFAASLDSNQLLHRGRTKWVLRQLASDLLPPALMQRRKQGFGVPIAQWLRDPLREAVEDILLGSTARHRGWFAPQEVEKLLHQHMSGTDMHKEIWSLLVLELWASRWVQSAD